MHSHGRGGKVRYSSVGQKQEPETRQTKFPSFEYFTLHVGAPPLFFILALKVQCHHDNTLPYLTLPYLSMAGTSSNT